MGLRLKVHANRIMAVCETSLRNPATIVYHVDKLYHSYLTLRPTNNVQLVLLTLLFHLKRGFRAALSLVDSKQRPLQTEYANVLLIVKQICRNHRSTLRSASLCLRLVIRYGRTLCTGSPRNGVECAIEKAMDW